MKVRKKLSKWIDENSSRADFARGIGCSDGYATLLLQGERGASWETAKKIEQFTGGAVTAPEIMGERPDMRAAV